MRLVVGSSLLATHSSVRATGFEVLEEGAVGGPLAETAEFGTKAGATEAPSAITFRRVRLPWSVCIL